jgi:hypothetical protein
MITSCTCQQGGRTRDGGREPSAYNCNTMTVINRDGGGNGFDGGFTFDAGACPAGTMDGEMCTMATFCRNGNQNCVCGGNAQNRTWRCF